MRKIAKKFKSFTALLIIVILCLENNCVDDPVKLCDLKLLENRIIIVILCLENNCVDDPVKLCDFQLLENRIIIVILCLENNCVDDPVKLCDFQLLENRIMKTVDSVYQVGGTIPRFALGAQITPLPIIFDFSFFLSF